MNKLFSIFFALLILGVTGCSSESMEEEDVKAFVKEYKSAQYTVEDPNKLSQKHPQEIQTFFSEKVEPYLSAKELENLKNNRDLTIGPRVAIMTNKRLELQDVKLEKVEEKDNGSIDYDYTLILNYYDDNSSEVIKKEGELTIKNDGDLKITRDWEKLSDFEREAIKNSIEDNK